MITLIYSDLIEDLKSICETTEEPTFENTIVMFDRAGQMLSRTGGVFENLCSSNGLPELQEIELKMAAPLAAHHNQVSDKVSLLPALNYSIPLTYCRCIHFPNFLKESTKSTRRDRP